MSIPDAPKTFSMFPPTLVSLSTAFSLQRTDIQVDWLFSTLSSTFFPSAHKIFVALIIFNILHLETVSPVDSLDVSDLYCIRTLIPVPVSSQQIFRVFKWSLWFKSHYIWMFLLIEWRFLNSNHILLFKILPDVYWAKLRVNKKRWWKGIRSWSPPGGCEPFTSLMCYNLVCWSQGFSWFFFSYGVWKSAGMIYVNKNLYLWCLWDVSVMDLY